MEEPVARIWQLQVCKSEWARKFIFCYFHEMENMAEYMVWLREKKDRVYRIFTMEVEYEDESFKVATENDAKCQCGEFQKVKFFKQI